MLRFVIAYLSPLKLASLGTCISILSRCPQGPYRSFSLSLHVHTPVVLTTYLVLSHHHCHPLILISGGAYSGVCSVRRWEMASPVTAQRFVASKVASHAIIRRGFTFGIPKAGLKA
jgi:hypothetical protein